MTSRRHITLMVTVAAIAAIVGAVLLNRPPRTIVRKAYLLVTRRAQGCTLLNSARDVWDRHRFGTYRRYVRLAQRDRDLTLYDTPLGRFWAAGISPGGVGAIVAEQMHDIYGDMSRGVREGDVVFDCGASFGAFTRVALRRGASKVVAVEPSPRAVECLRRNFAKEVAEGRVILYAKGVWDREERLHLMVDPHDQARDSFMSDRGRRKGPEVELVPIDVAVAELGLHRVDFIKMDIEGAERRALQGATKTLRRWRPRLAIAAYRSAGDPEAIAEIVRAAVPEYRIAYGACEESNAGDRIVPGVVFFH